MDDLTARFHQGLRLRSEGRLPEAAAVFEGLAQTYPTVGAPRAFLGLTRCNLGDFDRGLADLRQAIVLEPRNADWHCNLGVALFAYDELAEAETCVRRALALAPSNPDAWNNLGLVLKARGDFAGAVTAARRALAARPDFPQAKFNQAYPLLALGKFAEAWTFHDHRPNPRVNLRDPHLAVSVDHHDRLPAPPAPIVLHGEQGLGDALFFLRFAPALRARGHRLAFWGDVRLHPLLARTGLFDHLMRSESMPAPGLATIWVGDLPRLLGATSPSAFPPSIPLQADSRLREEALDRVKALGPPPYIGLTWRAGLPRKGMLVLAKSVPPLAMARAIASAPGTLVSVQRNPAASELEDIAAHIGRPVHDLGAANADLDRMLALLDVLDDYATVSNTNVHLRASLGHSARVLVPWPPEWRWLAEGGTSPWFRSMAVYREARGGGWEDALAQLEKDLAASFPRP